MSETDTADNRKVRFFRHAESPGLMESDIMELKPYSSDVQTRGMSAMVEAGFLEGEEIRVLINIPGFSLLHAWFKPNYPLPLHSHDSDCLYYIVAGSIQYGTESLGPRDGFFIEANVPYTYKAGPEGVEILEFRHGGTFDFVNLAKNEAFYQKAVEAITANRESWSDAKPPSEIRR